MAKDTWDSDTRELLASYSYTNLNFQSAGLQYPLSLGVGTACDSHNEPHTDDSDIECGDVGILFTSDGSVQNTGFTIEYKLAPAASPPPPSPLAPPPITDCVGTPVRLSIVSGEHNVDDFVVYVNDVIEDESDVTMISFGSQELGAQYPDDSVRYITTPRCCTRWRGANRQACEHPSVAVPTRNNARV